MKITDIKNLETPLKKVLSRYPVAFAYVFGSQVIGKTHAGSDFDIAISFTSASKSEAFDLILEIFPELTRELKINSEKLDLSNFDGLPLPVRFRVVRDGKLIHLKDIELHRLRVLRTIKAYHDEEPFFSLATQEFLERAAAS